MDEFVLLWNVIIFLNYAIVIEVFEFPKFQN